MSEEDKPAEYTSEPEDNKIALVERAFQKKKKEKISPAKEHETKDKEPVIFSKITDFVCDLGDLFSKKQKSLALYKRLIEKTTFKHTEQISKHIATFRNFCRSNRDCILSQDKSKLVLDNISYSDKVFINMKLIFEWSDEKTTNTIWKHLLILLAYLDPVSGAKKVLKEYSENTNALITDTEGDPEGNFLNNIIGKLESKIDLKGESDPMKAMSAVLSSGILPEVMGEIQTALTNGSLDLNKLLASASGAMSELTNGGDMSGFDPTMLLGMLGGMK